MLIDAARFRFVFAHDLRGWCLFSERNLWGGTVQFARLYPKGAK